MPWLTPEDLAAAVCDRLVTAGLRPHDAQVVSRVLVDADVRGHRSHGVGLLPLYLDRIEQGGIATTATPRWERRGVVSTLDAQGGPGQVAAELAAGACAEAAAEHGMAAVAVRGNNHIGMLAAYRRHFAGRAVVGLIANISGASVAAPTGQRATLGNNALCAIVPRGGGEPFAIDLATGAVACGKIREAAADGRPVPAGWLVDPQGRPSTDARDLDRGGAVPVFGDYKGLCISLVVELLGGILGGGTVSPHVRRQRQAPGQPMDSSQLFVGFDPGAFGVEDPYDLVEDLAAAVLAGSDEPPSRPYFPDQQEAEASRAAHRDGIMVRSEVAAALFGQPEPSGDMA